MKKYKLIKEYSGSPKLESIVKLKDNGGYELENSTSYFMTKDKVENYPEFWEEVVEKDFEILVYKGKITYNQGYFKKCFGGYTFESLDGEKLWAKHGISPVIEVPTDCADIYSVKRLSDGEIFTIGDKVVGYNNSIAKIKTIDLVGEISLNIGTDKYEGFSLKNLKKVKEPLFKTEDGVDIFEDDEVTWLFSNNSSIAGTRKAEAEMYRNLKYFSTKEKAEEYILMNKPSLSLKEVLDNFSSSRDSTKERLTKIVKSKL